ncbi:MAG TPA: PA2169 family four-helix-bundle protein [Anaerolineales bacterium]|nr:PA2169 family four-helix-bundle protein [Anaerolineales bacterium]
MDVNQIVKILSNLYRIVEAGEKGFAVAAANVSNRGLKAHFKSYAQQRAQFKSEILAEIRRHGGDFKPRASIRGIIHRGRIDIVATLTIGAESKEKVVLNEAVLGERVAMRTYEKTLESELPSETQAIVAQQIEKVREVSERVNLLRGKEGKRLVVRLLDSEKDADRAVQALKNAGFLEEVIERITLSEAIELYEGKGITVLETVISGAFGGSLWGSLIGALAGISVAQVPGLEPFGATTIQGAWAFVALSGILLGGFFGAVLGLFIGAGVSEEDIYLYDQSIKDGQIVVRAVVDEGRAKEAGQIMAQINLESRAQAREAPA